jgi:hypothetical protein
MVSPVITGYYRYTDIFFEWCDRLDVFVSVLITPEQASGTP